MKKEILIDFLGQNYSKQQTQHLAEQCLAAEIALQDVLDLCFHDKDKIVFRAAWLLEHVEVSSPERFKSVLINFIKCYPNQINWSAQRHFTKIMMRLTRKDLMNFYRLKPDDFDLIIEATFDWLINSKTPLAVQCNAMNIIYQLSPYHEWVKEELKIVLEQKLLVESAALTSRAKRVLKKLK